MIQNTLNLRNHGTMVRQAYVGFLVSKIPPRIKVPICQLLGPTGLGYAASNNGVLSGSRTMERSPAFSDPFLARSLQILQICIWTDSVSPCRRRTSPCLELHMQSHSTSYSSGETLQNPIGGCIELRRTPTELYKVELLHSCLTMGVPFITPQHPDACDQYNCPFCNRQP